MTGHRWGSNRGDRIPKTYLGICEVTGKRQYASKRDAWAVARGFDRTLKPFQCDGCGAWHLGHLPDIVRRGELDRHDLKPGGER